MTRADLDAIMRRWDIRPGPDGGPLRAYRVRNSTEDANDVAAMAAELRAAREVVEATRDFLSVEPAGNYPDLRATVTAYDQAVGS